MSLPLWPVDGRLDHLINMFFVVTYKGKSKSWKILASLIM